MLLKSPVVSTYDKLKINTAGMNFFEQSVYAVEEFILLRRKLGKF